MPLAATLLLFSSCKKDSDNPTQPTGACNQNPAKIGSVYTMKLLQNGQTYTQTVTGDTTVNGLKYLRIHTNTGGQTGVGYLGVDASGQVWQITPPAGDLGSTNMIMVQTAKPAGTTWSYLQMSQSAPGIVDYKYTMTQVSTTETITVAGKSYSNGIKVKVRLDVTYQGTPMSSAETGFTWFCGLGIGGSEANGAPYSQLINFVY